MADIGIIGYGFVGQALTRSGCQAMPFVPYVPREEYPLLLHKFWTDLGMIRPGEWHYCARYLGPQISKEVWVFL
jgi:hypothetical protein